ncbi:MAG: hypothetical protein IJM24_07920 [Clostridia bacterium]|nr:hypothetical protein [Clostridia bacterium]
MERKSIKKGRKILTAVSAALTAALAFIQLTACVKAPAGEQNGPESQATSERPSEPVKRSEDNRIMDMIIWYDDDIGPSTNDRPEKGWYHLSPEHPNTISKSGMYRATTPLLGLYDQRKETTARQHLYWISALGCNAICVDWTNYTSYRTADSAGWKKYTVGNYLNAQNLLKTAAGAEGFDVPKIYFAARLSGENYEGLKDVLDDLYSLYEKYPDAWYRFDDGTENAGKPFIEIFIDWDLQAKLRKNGALVNDPRWNIRYTNGYMSGSTETDANGYKAVPADVPVWLFVENEEDNAAGEGMYRTFYSKGNGGRVEQMAAWASVHKGGFNWDALNNVVNGQTTFERQLRNVKELSPQALVIARWNYPLEWFEQPQEGISLYESTHIEPNVDFGFDVFDNVQQNLYALNNWLGEKPPLPAFTGETAGAMMLSLEGFPVEYRLGSAPGTGEWVYYNVNEGIPGKALTAGETYYLQTRNTFGESDILEFTAG